MTATMPGPTLVARSLLLSRISVALSIVLGMGLMVMGAEPVAACSFGPAPTTLESLAGAEAAFVGKLVSQDPPVGTPIPGVEAAPGEPRPAGPREITVRRRYRVDQVIKGVVGDEIELTKIEGGVCGANVVGGSPVGTRQGVILGTRGATGPRPFTDLKPEVLKRANRLLNDGPRPRPDSRAGRPVLVLGAGGIGSGVAFTVDRSGRVVKSVPAQAAALAPCPGGRRLVVLEQAKKSTIVVRDVSRLRVLNRLPVPSEGKKVSLGGEATAAWCHDEDGRAATGFLAGRTYDPKSNSTDGTPSSMLVTMSNRRVRIVTKGPYRAAASAGDGRTAWLVSGTDPKHLSLVRVDVRTGTTRVLGPVPPGACCLSMSPDERFLVMVSPAFVHTSPWHVVVRYDIRSAKRHQIELQPAASPPGVPAAPVGMPVWLDNETFFLPGTPGRVFDRDLRLVRQISRWGVRPAAAIDGRIYSTAKKRDPAAPSNEFAYKNSGVLRSVGIDGGKPRPVSTYDLIYPWSIAALPETVQPSAMGNVALLTAGALAAITAFVGLKRRRGRA